MTERTSKKAIIVLGYSLNDDDSLHPLLKARLTKALTLYKPGVPIIVSGGMPPGRAQTCPLSEADAMRRFLLEKGVLDSDIFLEEFSLTTFMNAFYTRIFHAYPMGIKEAYVVSNEFHMPLVRYSFGLIYGDSVALEFVPAPNEGLTADEVKKWDAIIKRVIAELYPMLFEGMRPGDLSALHHLFNEAKSTNPSPLRVKFENEMRRIRSFNDDVSLYGII